MKRMLTAALALLLALSLCACGAQDTDDTPTYPAAFSGLETLIDTAREEGRLTVCGTGDEAYMTALCEKFEEKLTQCNGNLERAAVALAQNWRGDQAMRQLDSLMIVANRESMLILSGTGEVIEPDDGVAAIGSGGNYALAAARALVDNTDLPARDIAEKALHIAASICVYTNDNVIVDEV